MSLIESPEHRESADKSNPSASPAPGDQDVEFSKLQQPFNVHSVIGISYSLSATPLAVGTYLVFAVDQIF
ncbi:hypothetical protein FSARC_12010 [Fusarium sarcochroum]|uniref:Uncharacterized protein n=1 Tax=Fusarium sarcochroum TaxID=1208366 RepID=A0A8H4TBF9_9HYPO|nr:hypothetical protein FSARC_12010 [Fusarium sarcochroum]